MRTLIQITATNLLIWMMTHLIALVAFLIANAAGATVKPVLCDTCGLTLFYTLAIAAILSSPVIVLLFPVLFLLEKKGYSHRNIFLSMIIVFFISAVTIIVFHVLVPFEGEERISAGIITLSYIPFSQLSFYTITNFLLKKREAESQEIILDL